MNAYVKGLVTVAVAAFVLSGCTEGVLPDDGEKAPVGTPSGASGTGSSGVGTGTDSGSTSTTRPLPGTSAWQGDPIDDPSRPLLQTRVVYFDFDSATIRAADRPVIEAHAAHIAENPNESVVLEGHADERGSREYNVGLGDRRAQAVRRLLTLLGVSDGQLRTVSYGEERPAEYGSGESVWSRNRRVEFNYQR